MDTADKYPDIAIDYYKKAPAILMDMCRKCSKQEADGTCKQDYCPIEDVL